MAVTRFNLPYPKPHAIGLRKLHGLTFYRTGVITEKGRKSIFLQVLHCRNIDFRPFFAPVTLTLTEWPLYTNLTRISCITVLPNVQIWTSYVKAFESYRLTNRQTSRQTQPKYIPRRFAGGLKLIVCSKEVSHHKWAVWAVARGGGVGQPIKMCYRPHPSPFSRQLVS